MADALADDPLWVYAVPDTGRRRLPHLIRLRSALRMITPTQAARVAVDVNCDVLREPRIPGVVPRD